MVIPITGSSEWRIWGQLLLQEYQEWALYKKCWFIHFWKSKMHWGWCKYRKMRKICNRWYHETCDLWLFLSKPNAMSVGVRHSSHVFPTTTTPPNTNFSATSRPARELKFGTDTHCVGFWQLKQINLVFCFSCTVFCVFIFNQ